MQKKYRALRFISGLYKVIAIIIFLLSMGGAMVMVLVGNSFGYAYHLGSLLFAVIGFLGALLSGSFVALSLYAFANLIELLIATEENTRMTAALLNRLGRRLQAPARPAPTVPPAK